MSEEQVCNVCNAVATGYAFIGEDRYCHGDHDLRPTCYERATNPLRVLRQSSPGAWDRIARHLGGAS